MTEVSFYHLTQTPLDKALPMLLEKVMSVGKRAVVLVGDQQKLKQVDKFLWSYKPESFLPHGDEKTGNAEHQPIYLTTKEENPNGASFLVSLDAHRPKYIADFERCLDVFDGHSIEEVKSARTRWKEYSEEECLDLTYWKQHDGGVWEKAG